MRTFVSTASKFFRRLPFWGGQILLAAIVIMAGSILIDVHVILEKSRFGRTVAANQHMLNTGNESTDDGKQLACLAEALFYEAEPFNAADMRAIAHVIDNRARSGLFPDTLCGVIKQVSEKGTWQFSYNLFQQKGAKSRYAKKGDSWQFAKRVAAQVYAEMAFGRFIETDSLYYHASYMEPYWVRVDIGNCRMKLLGQMGAHLHYGLNDPSEKKDCLSAKRNIQVAQATKKVPLPRAKPGIKAAPQATSTAMAFIPTPRPKGAGQDAIAELIGASGN